MADCADIHTLLGTKERRPLRHLPRVGLTPIPRINHRSSIRKRCRVSRDGSSQCASHGSTAWVADSLKPGEPDGSG